MLSFSNCRIVRALISELLVGTIILLRTSESEADASVRHREVQYDICAERHLFTLLFEKCSLLLIVIQSRWEYWIRYAGAKARNGSCWRVPACFRSAESIMTDEKLQSELRRLNSLQSRARQDEVFGGFSRAQRIEYNKRERRIHDVETELQAGADSEQSGMTAGADQR